MKRKEWKHVIFSDDPCQFDEYEKSFKENAPYNFAEDEEIPEYTWEMFGEDIEIWLDDEKCNLDYNINGRIIALGNLGLWYGRRGGYKIVGNKLSDIFSVYEDYNEYYCDQDDCCAICAHHDGTNYITFRVISSEVENILDWETKDCQWLYEHSHSLMPYIADIFGWKRDRRMKRGQMWRTNPFREFDAT